MSEPGHDELAAQLVVWVVGSLTTGLLLRADRRRLPPEGRARMWYGTTVALAVSGLFLPSPLTFGAHVWATRRGWTRLPLSLLGAALALGLTLLLSEATLAVIELLWPS
jgi:hypothetical protein